MKPIKIVSLKKDEIEAALKAANGRASIHTVSTFDEVESIAKSFFNDVYELLGSKTKCNGAKLHYRSGQKLPNSYKNSRKVTHLVFEIKHNGSVFLTSIECIEAWNEAGYDVMSLTKAQDVLAKENFSKKYTVQGE